MEILQTITDTLDTYNIDYYLDMSTLIAIVRDDDFSSANQKIYLSILREKDYEKMHSIASILRKHKLKASVQTFFSIAKKDDDFLLDAYNIKSITVNSRFVILFKYKVDNKLTWYIRNKKYQLFENLNITHIEELESHDIKYKIPQNYEAYLNALYPDWHTYSIENIQGLRPCTLKDKVQKIIRTGRHEGKRFKYHCNKTQALKILKATVMQLDKHNIAYYLDFGTLIGAMREKGFIDWDDDIDISLLHEEDYYKMEKVISDIKRKGFAVSRVPFLLSINNQKAKAKNDPSIEIFVDNIDFTSEHNTRVFKVKHYNGFEKIINKVLTRLGSRARGGKSLDIFLKYKKDGQLIWMAQHKVHHIEDKLLSKELVEIDFYNIKCKIPKNYDEYLTSMYGEWQRPMKDWQYYEEDTVIR